MKKFVALILLMMTAPAMATVITMNEVNDQGIVKAIGTMTVTESAYGLVFSPDLQGLTPGLHGFHLHQNNDCSPAQKEGKMVPALAAGGHYDPLNTGKHGTPWGEGHAGDLPPLYVNQQGNANQPVLAPRLRDGDLPGRALIIHAGGDNHSDHPAPLGGGGARVACGVFY